MRRTDFPHRSSVPFGVEFIGPFASSEVIVLTDGVPLRETHPLVEPAIDATWQELTTEREADGRVLYDSPLARLADWLVDGGRLTLRVGDTTYREFVGTHLYNAHLLRSVGARCFANALGTSAIVVTADGCLVLGRRNHRVLYHGGYLHPFGGMLEAGDRTPDGSYDIFAAMRRELIEELKVSQQEIADVICTGLVRDLSIYQPELVFTARLRLTLADLRARFSAETDEEHAALESCDDLPDAIRPFLISSRRVTPVAVAALLLHGRHCWGSDWYESTAYLFFGDLPNRTRADSPSLS